MDAMRVNAMDWPAEIQRTAANVRDNSSAVRVSKIQFGGHRQPHSATAGITIARKYFSVPRAFNAPITPRIVRIEAVPLIPIILTATEVSAPMMTIIAIISIEVNPV